MNPARFTLWLAVLALAGWTMLGRADDQLAGGGEAKKPAPPLPAAAASEQITIKHGPNTLAAVLHLPKGKGPHPVIVFIHGSGPADRTSGRYYEAIWQRFLEAGFACFSWDKPGIGASKNPSGRFAPQSYFERAAELRHALDLLKARPDIDGKRMGCWGVSQAGWIMPMVASRSRDVAFIIAVSCPGQTAVVQSAYVMRCHLVDRGIPEENAEIAAAINTLLLNLLPTATPSEEYWNFLASTNPGYVEGPYKRPEIDGSLRLDPVPMLEKTTCPVLAIFGSKDRLVDPEASAKVYQRAFEKSGNRHGTIRMFADADHGLFVRDKETGQARYAPGYLDAMTEWLRKLPVADAAKE